MDFKYLLKKQQELDELIEAERKNGFIPRKRTKEDILFALDDEIQEWMRELPDEMNFKTWKEKTYNKDDELLELTDILFFILQLINYSDYKSNYDLLDAWKENDIIHDFDTAYIEREFINNLVIERIIYMKEALYNNDIKALIFIYMTICKLRGFECEDIIESYKKKWEYNAAGRINGDWAK